MKIKLTIKKKDVFLEYLNRFTKYDAKIQSDKQIMFVLDHEKIEGNLLGGENFVKNSILYHKEVFDEANIDIEEPVYLCVSGVQELIKKIKIFTDNTIPITIHTTKFTDKAWLSSDVTSNEYAGRKFEYLELATKLEFNNKRLKLNYNFNDVFIFKQNFKWINEKRKESLYDDSDNIALARFKMTKDDINTLITLVDMDGTKEKDRKLISISFKDGVATFGSEKQFEYSFEYEGTDLLKADIDVDIMYYLFQKLDHENYDVLLRYIFPPSDTSADSIMLTFKSEESNTTTLITRAQPIGKN